jgi:hypothetical protein
MSSQLKENVNKRFTQLLAIPRHWLSNGQRESEGKKERGLTDY